MQFDQLPTLGALLPIAACTDPMTTASTLDRLADLALFHGRAFYAEHLAHKAEAIREAGQ